MILLTGCGRWTPVPQMLRVMKLLAILLTVFALHVSATGRSQTVSYSGKNVPLEDVFKEITRQTGYKFFYDFNLIRNESPVNVTFDALNIEQALTACLKNTSLAFSMQENTIVISKKLPGTMKDNGDAQPPGEIHGHVTNDHGEPLAGANVIIKRTHRGTQTNAKGEFMLKDVRRDDELIVTFIGYQTMNVKVGGGTEFPLVMQPAKEELDKVVVQAYGTTTQRLATGNIATVTAAEIERQPVINPLTAIEGKVPGLVITQTSGYASAPVKVEIRGRAVINPKFPSDPLYIVDGVPLTVLETGQAGGYASGSSGFTQNGLTGPAGGQNPFFSINPQDIESVTVLKDADATAIYGSRGANGVIIVTTKTGKPGKTKLDMNVYHGTTMVTQHYPMMNTPQYVQMRREAFKNDNVAMTLNNAYDLLAWDTTRNVDWQKELWGHMGQMTDAQLSFSGGARQTNFRVGGGYQRTTSILTVHGADQRASVQFNITHRTLNQKLTISFTSMYTYAMSDMRYTPAVVTFAPDAPAFFTPSGQLNWDAWKLQPGILEGFAGALLHQYTAKTGFLNSSITLTYNIVNGLDFKTQLGYSSTHQSQIDAVPIAAQNPAHDPKGQAQFGNNNNGNSIVEPQLEYNHALGKGKLNVLVGGSYQSVSQDGNVLSGSGYVNDNLLFSIANAPVKGGSDVFLRYKYAAFFARLNYNWRDKYILNLSARRDGSSNFGPGKQYGNFGAVGAAWIFTEENWIKDHLPGLSFGKLRASYGITGSDNIGSYQYLTQWSSAPTYPYNGSPTYVPLLLDNPDLQWQTNQKLETALQLGFLHNRLSAQIAWYRNRCGNQLIDENLPYLAGFQSIAANFPATVENSGWELTMTGKLIDKPTLSWEVNFNIGVNRNKLLAFPNLDQSPYANTFQLGQSLNVRWLLHYQGIDPATGLYTFEDRNHNGTVDYSYQVGQSPDVYPKDMSVRYEGGFGTDLRYKGWLLSLFFHFRNQELPSAISAFPGRVNSNQSTQLLDHWQKPGDHTRYPKYTTLSGVSYSTFLSFSDGVFSDGSYLRLQNVSLSYDFAASWLSKINIRMLRVYARGQNLLLFTRYNGIDPDAPGFGNLPLFKVITLGIQLTF